MSSNFNVVVLGGYGNFGSIIAAKLASMESVTTFVAGRDTAKTATISRQISAHAATIDINDEALAERFRELQADLIISTVGPFQNQDYRVARAAISAGAHYIDIADSREFVCGIVELDKLAKSNNVLVVSGASSVPALAAAVIDRFQFNVADVREIDFGISSSEKTPGIATVAAVLGYCGKPIRQWRNGTWNIVYGWQNLTRHRFQAPLGTRWFANCDIPDLALFPERYQTARTVRFQAGFGLQITLLGTWALSWLVRFGLVRNAASLANTLHRLARRVEVFGDGHSGMFVNVTGAKPDGSDITQSWEIVAHNNHGLNIPCMAAVALTRKLLQGHLSLRGAVPCVGIISLEEYLDELHGLDISWSDRLVNSNL